MTTGHSATEPAKDTTRSSPASRAKRSRWVNDQTTPTMR